MELMHPRILQIGIVDRGARAAEPVPRRHEDGSR